MAKANIRTGEDDQPLHTRTTSDSVETQAVVLGIDGSDGIVPAHATDGLSVKVTNATLTVAALPAGSNAIGTVEVTRLPSIPAGANSIGTVVVGAGTAAIGRVDIGSALPAGTNAIGKLAANSGVDIGDVDIGGGTVAHDAADSGNPIKVGGRARTALPAAVAQDDRVDAINDKFGRRLALVAPLDAKVSATVNFTTNVAATVLAAPGSGLAIVVTDVIVVNSHTSVGTKVTIRDDTTAKIGPLGAGPNYGGWQRGNADGLFVATANRPVTVICGTTGADVDVYVAGYMIPA